LRLLGNQRHKNARAAAARRIRNAGLEAAGIMKALTIKQPWVHAILHEGKDIENRSWQRNFRVTKRLLQQNLP
jgi:hypothetical protein